MKALTKRSRLPDPQRLGVTRKLLGRSSIMSLTPALERWSRRGPDPNYRSSRSLFQHKLIPANPFDNWSPNIGGHEFDPEHEAPCTPEELEHGLVQVSLHVWADTLYVKMSIHG